MDELEDDEITPIDWESKYKQLKKNFDALDRHNDVLYRAYVAGRRLRNAKGTFSDYLIEDFFATLEEVEKFENDLKKDHSSLK
jgi:hypothetical protein